MELFYTQCWETYFGNVIGYRLQVTLFKSSVTISITLKSNVTDYI